MSTQPWPQSHPFHLPPPLKHTHSKRESRSLKSLIWFAEEPTWMGSEINQKLKFCLYFLPHVIPNFYAVFSMEAALSVQQEFIVTTKAPWRYWTDHFYGVFFFFPPLYGKSLNGQHLWSLITLLWFQGYFWALLFALSLLLWITSSPHFCHK